MTLPGGWLRYSYCINLVVSWTDTQSDSCTLLSLMVEQILYCIWQPYCHKRDN